MSSNYENESRTNETERDIENIDEVLGGDIQDADLEANGGIHKSFPSIKGTTYFCQVCGSMKVVKVDTKICPTCHNPTLIKITT